MAEQPPLTRAHVLNVVLTYAAVASLWILLSDKAVEWLHAVRAQDAQKPWFLYYSTGCSHAPHHVPKHWADRYKGRPLAGVLLFTDGNATDLAGAAEGKVDQPVRSHAVSSSLL